MDSTDLNEGSGLDNDERTYFVSALNADSYTSLFESLLDVASLTTGHHGVGLWWCERKRNGFTFKGGRFLEDEHAQRNSFIGYEKVEAWGLISSKDPVGLSDAILLPDRSVPQLKCLAVRIRYYNRTTGFLVLFPERQFKKWSDEDHNNLRVLGLQLSSLCANFERHSKLSELLELVRTMSEANSKWDVNDLALLRGGKIVRSDRAVVRRVDLQNGHLNYDRAEPKAASPFDLSQGEGVTGQALRDQRIYRLDDVTTDEWSPIFRQLWPQLPPTRSELAVPILLKKQRVLNEGGPDHVDKPFGVLNFESTAKAAFSTLDEYCADVIAERVARVSERIEFDSKLDKLRRAAQDISTKRDWDAIVDTLLEQIQNSLGYEFVSLSIVDQDNQLIQCVRARGISRAHAFCKEARHDLNSNHVQADVYKRKKTRVPLPEDHTLSAISQKFELQRFIRVFIPMIVPSRNEVIGTVTAGYDRTYRPYIYERDVLLLKTLVAFATNAMEAWQRGEIDTICHEMNAPLSSVRGNLEWLRTRRSVLPEETIDRVLEDTEGDANLVYYQMQQLEYVLGGSVGDVANQPLNVERVKLFGDIISKQINQLKPLVRDKHLDPKRITYEGVQKVDELYIDKGKISQVFFNLFVNAIKYAKDADTFRILIDADSDRENYVVKFCDWGIGVPAGLEEKIFQDRYRGPAPSGKTIKGSGLGLTIARKLMKEHGGDIVLEQNSEPTIFHVMFPKRLRRRS